MQFKLRLLAASHSLLSFNYPYLLSAAIYRIIQQADGAFADFLHNHGYGQGRKQFKLFTFSDIFTPFRKSGDRMQLLTGEAGVVVCFYLPQAAEHFIRGLFLHRQIEIADRVSKTVFEVMGVEILAETIRPAMPVLLQPLSPLVVGRKNGRGHYDYRSPLDADFTECLHYNWMEKCAAVGLPVETGAGQPPVRLTVVPFTHPPQQRLITIKGGTGAETKIRGYTKFRLAVEAPAAMIELALGAGLGLHNAQGMGCVAIVDF